MKTASISFSFGKNWQSFAKTVKNESIILASKDIDEWLGEDFISGKSVVDIGCGSGIQSFVFYLKGAKEIVSFDVDMHSVEATKTLWLKSNSPTNWRIFHDSILVS